MIHIIKQGHRQQVATFTCPICSTQFSFEQEDVAHDDGDTYHAPVDMIACPICGKCMEVNIDKDFPWLPLQDYWKDN